MTGLRDQLRLAHDDRPTWLVWHRPRWQVPIWAGCWAATGGY